MTCNQNFRFQPQLCRELKKKEVDFNQIVFIDQKPASYYLGFRNNSVYRLDSHDGEKIDKIHPPKSLSKWHVEITPEKEDSHGVEAVFVVQPSNCYPKKHLFLFTKWYYWLIDLETETAIKNGMISQHWYKAGKASPNYTQQLHTVGYHMRMTISQPLVRDHWINQDTDPFGLGEIFYWRDKNSLLYNRIWFHTVNVTKEECRFKAVMSPLQTVYVDLTTHYKLTISTHNRSQHIRSPFRCGTFVWSRKDPKNVSIVRQKWYLFGKEHRMWSCSVDYYDLERHVHINCDRIHDSDVWIGCRQPPSISNAFNLFNAGWKIALVVVALLSVTCCVVSCYCLFCLPRRRRRKGKKKTDDTDGTDESLKTIKTQESEKTAAPLDKTKKESVLSSPKKYTSQMKPTKNTPRVDKSGVKTKSSSFSLKDKVMQHLSPKARNELEA